MILSLARFISFISNPLFVLIPLPFVLVYKTSKNINYALHWSIYSLLFILIVVAFILYGVKKGMFTDLDVSKKEQRPMLFSLTILVSLLYIIGLYLFHGPFVLLITVFGILMGILIVSMINIKIKASIHVATISSVTTAASIVYGGKYFLLLALIPVIGWSRVKIKRHTIPETIVGGIVGSLLSVGMYTLTKLFMH